jgi:hypothetical protein
MRTIRTIALVLSVAVLSSSLPVFGAVRTRDGETGLRDRSSITVIVKRIIQHFLGITPTEQVGGGKPAPASDPVTVP